MEIVTCCVPDYQGEWNISPQRILRPQREWNKRTIDSGLGRFCQLERHHRRYSIMLWPLDGHPRGPFSRQGENIWSTFLPLSNHSVIHQIGYLGFDVFEQQLGALYLHQHALTPHTIQLLQTLQPLHTVCQVCQLLAVHFTGEQVLQQSSMKAQH